MTYTNMGPQPGTEMPHRTTIRTLSHLLIFSNFFDQALWYIKGTDELHKNQEQEKGETKANPNLGTPSSE